MKITVQLKLRIWQQFSIDVPEGKTPEDFVKEIKEHDPSCSFYENDGIEYLIATEQPIMAEYYTEDLSEMIDQHFF